MKDRLISVISLLNKTTYIHKGAALLGSVILFLLLCLSFVDVIGRYLFSHSIPGVVEISGPIIVIVVFLLLGYPNLKEGRDGHISIDILLQKLPLRYSLVAKIIIGFLTLGTISLLIWGCTAYALSVRESSLIIEVWQIPVLPILFLIPVGYALLLLLVLRDFLKNILAAWDLHIGARLWLLALAGAAVSAAVVILWIQPDMWNIDPFRLGIIGVGVMFLLLLIGMPIAIAMMLASFIFLAHLYGIQGISVFFGGWTYSILSDYSWTVMAFFMLMGYVILHANFGRDLFDSAFKWLGHLPGGLALATIWGGATFSTVVGNAAATTIVGGAIAIPEMRRYQYNDSLSAGTIAAAATLGPMIPPSTQFIIYGLVTENSIGDLFIAGIVPGLLLTFAFMAYIYTRCKINPALGLAGPSTKIGEKVSSLKYCWPLVVIFLSVVFGIYFGIFTPTEAGGVGAATTLIMGFVLKRFSWKKLVSIFRDTGMMLGIMFFIIVSTIIFGHFMSVSQIPENVQRIVDSLALAPITIILILCVVYLILGCFLDPVAIIIITMPAFYPLVLNLGYGPIWFGVVVVLLTNLGMITPPVGMICFALKGTVPNLSMGNIFKGSLPFVFVSLGVCAFIIAFPKIVTWLPVLLQR